MVEWVQQAEGIWQYVVLFLVSILPFLDVFYIIPVGVALGMSPIAVGIISFLGNFIKSTLIVIYSYVYFIIFYINLLFNTIRKKN